MLEVTHQNEGGFQADPNDSGNVVDGEVIGTNMGITPATLAAFRGVTATSITQQDMKDLTRGEADSIFNREFLVNPKIDQLNPSIQQAVFDFGVTAGPAQAIKIIQRVAGVKADGVIGQDTLVATEGIDRGEVIDEFIKFYEALAESSPEKAKFLKGWVDRANRNR